MTHSIKPWRTTLRQAPALCAILAAFLAPAGLAFADDAGISVSGVGVAKGRPTMVEIGARLSGDGELAADASVKYNDLKKKVIAAMDALKDPNLSLEFSGPTLGLATDPGAQMRLMQGQTTDSGKEKVQISEQVRLILKGADKLEPDKLVAAVLKIIDTAKDAGLQVGNAPTNYIQMQIRAQNGQNGDTIVVFKIPDRSELEAQAYEKAMADARSKAERLAKLSGAKLGRVFFVQDQGTSHDNGGAQQSLLAAIYGAAVSTAAAPETKEVESTALADIPVTVHLTVKFELEKQ